MRCARCGEPMNATNLDVVQTKELVVAGSVNVQHAAGQCPREIAAFGPPAASTGRRFFEMQVVLREVFPDRQENDVLADFTATGTASSPTDAVGEGSELQRDYTTKVDRMIKTVGFADVPVRAVDAAGEPVQDQVAIGFDTQPHQRALDA